MGQYHLRQLELDYNSLDSLPEELCKLKNLEYLSLTHNALHHLPNDATFNPHSIPDLEIYVVGN